MPKNVYRAIKKLKKAFDDAEKLKDGDGPGAVLLQIASKFQDLDALNKEDSVFSYLHEKVEFNMRGNDSLHGAKPNPAVMA
jgi:hypothetical protein